MSKKQQKWIAIFVTVTFVWLLQVSAMPLNAANAPAREQVSSASTEQAPSFLEQEGDSTKAVPAKKKSSLLLIIGGAVVLAAVAAVLVLVVFKTKYDITGEWKFSWKRDTDADWLYKDRKFVCSGDKKQGTYEFHQFTNTVLKGPYTVEKKNVNFTIEYSSNSHYVYYGTFETKDKITGTLTKTETSQVGTWELVRVTTN